MCATSCLQPEALASAGSMGSHCEGLEEKRGQTGSSRDASPAGAPPGVTGEAPREERLLGPQSRAPPSQPLPPAPLCQCSLPTSVLTCSPWRPCTLSALTRPGCTSHWSGTSRRRGHTSGWGFVALFSVPSVSECPPGPISCISPHSPCMSVAHAPCGGQALPGAAPCCPGHVRACPPLDDQHPKEGPRSSPGVLPSSASKPRPPSPAPSVSISPGKGRRLWGAGHMACAPLLMGTSEYVDGGGGTSSLPAWLPCPCFQG